jgi:uncharacterized protein YjiK
MTLMPALAAQETVIAEIPEASGITYSSQSDTLFVVNDEGTIYELSKKGQILREKYIGNYNLEGIVVDDNKNLLIVAVEGQDDILILSKEDMRVQKEISIQRTFNGVKVLEKGGDGLEGLALYKNELYLSNQSKNRYPTPDSSVIVVIDYDLTKKKQKIKRIIDHGYSDIAGLVFYNNTLFMVSDKESLLIQYDVKKDTVMNQIKLSKESAQEGIAFDATGVLFIADDNGQILRIEKPFQAVR